MRRVLLFVAFAFCTTARADLLLSLDPATQTASVGENVLVSIVLAGLQGGVAPSVGAFDLHLQFAGNVLSLAPVQPVTFGDALGMVPAEALGGYVPSPGDIELFEVSLLLPFQLDALHGDQITLATLQFHADAAGTSPLAFSSIVIDDAFGAKLPVIASSASVTVVPEPQGALISATIGALGLLVLKITAGTWQSLRGKDRVRWS